MSIDLSEFHDIFFEECFEGLEVMESGLLTLDNGTDIDEINSIFRAAHSIKGGSASFGFPDISTFTHVMETLLDEMRDGRREVSRPIVDLLLESVDILNAMVTAARNGEDSDQERTAIVHKKLDAMLASSCDPGIDSKSKLPEETAIEESGPETKTEATNPGWKINFRPFPEMMKSGNDPARIFRELQSLAELDIEIDISELPDFEVMVTDSCYLNWTLHLYGDVGKDEVEELFSWVEDESELVITALGEEPFETEAGSSDIPDPVVNPKSSPGDKEESLKGETISEKKPANTPVAKTNTAKATTTKPAKESGSIRVGIDKVDELINMVGELVITQSMLSQISSELDVSGTKQMEKLLDGITQLERNTRELQEGVLQIRMLPISFSFSRFPRLVRDLSSKVGKKVNLTMTGEHTEVDKTVLEKIGDPLVHLVRNSLDHGIETPEQRKATGKEEIGQLELCAYHEGGDIIIKVIDDGAGLNKDRILSKALEKGLVSENEELTDERVFNLIFQPGFSTAEQVSDVSGRGVGMDVVRRNVRDLGGNVSINSNQGAGSTVTIRLPLTLAILDGQLVQIGNETYIVPLVSIIESLQMDPAMRNSISGQSELYRLREEYIPIIRVNTLFEMNSGTKDLNKGLLVVVESDGQQVGLFVDDLLGQQQVVIKSLEANFKQIQGISGATILGDGTVALIMDVPGLIQRHFESCRRENKLTAVA